MVFEMADKKFLFFIMKTQFIMFCRYLLGQGWRMQEKYQQKAFLKHFIYSPLTKKISFIPNQLKPRSLHANPPNLTALIFLKLMNEKV